MQAPMLLATVAPAGFVFGTSVLALDYTLLYSCLYCRADLPFTCTAHVVCGAGFYASVLTQFIVWYHEQLTILSQVYFGTAKITGQTAVDG
jgi:hypothetical protein